MSLIDVLRKRQARSQPSTNMHVPEVTHDIEKNLMANPPATKGAPVEQVTKPIPAPAASSEGTQCPTCGKMYKQISRHKCPKAAAAPVNEGNTIEYPTEAMLDVILPSLHGPALDGYLRQYGVTRHNPGDDSKFREVAIRLISQQRDGVPTTGLETETETKTETKSETETKPGTKSKSRAPCFDLLIGVEIAQSEDMRLVYFHELIHIVEKKIKEVIGIHWIEVEYGKGKVELVEVLEGVIQAGDLDGQTLVVTTRTHAYNVVADLLRQYARNVIVGVQ